MQGEGKTPPRRVRVAGERNRSVYERPDGKYEIGYTDSAGKQRWRGPFDTITAARAERDAIASAKGKGQRVQPNPRLRFGEAADRWLADQVAGLRPSTRDGYRNSVETHLRPRWGARRLDSITTDDAAQLVRELRAKGKAETTIATILIAANRVFRFAARRMNWHGENPIAGLENGERPKVSQTPRRRIFQGDELAQTLAAAQEPWRTLFAFAAATGARISECLGLVWSDLDLRDVEEAAVTFAYQVERTGERDRVELKTEESRRTVELPRALARMLLAHRARSLHSQPGSFVFATRSGKPIGQRNTARALRAAMRAAVDAGGCPTFPILHERDAHGRRMPVPRGAVPSFHGYRHLAASEALAAGESAEEVSWQLGHRNSAITRTVYVQEIKSAERTARRRAKMEARYGPILEGVMKREGNEAHQTDRPHEAEIVELRPIRDAAQ